MSEEREDRLGMTDEQWERFQAYTHGYGEQDEYGIDISLLRESLRLTPSQRLQELQEAHEFFVKMENARNNQIPKNHRSS